MSKLVRRPPLVALVAAALALGFTVVVVLRSDEHDGTRHRSPLDTSIEALLGQRAGFAREATGGASGPLVHVTTADDDAGNPGSLRAALARPGPAWIVFDDDYTIHFHAGMAVTSDKTIDGRGRNITLTGFGLPGLILKDVTNVIIENLHLTDFGDPSRTKLNDPDDAILLDGATLVWIDHNTLARAGDKLIATVGAGTMTISWNHFLDQQQTVQLGAMATSGRDRNTRATLHHNFFDGTAYRNPVVSYGWAHAYNNYLRDWTLYGARSERGAQLLLEANMFDNNQGLPVTKWTAAGNGCNDGHTLCDNTPGFIRLVDNLVLAGANPQDNEPGNVFDPATQYPDTAEPATRQLADQIAALAGALGA